MCPKSLLALIICQGRRSRCRGYRNRNLRFSLRSFILTAASATVMDKKNLVVVSGNKKKLDELILLLEEDFPYQLVGLSLDLPEYQGEAENITLAKCQAASSLIEGPVLVEDTSLEFKALNGLPGPYVKWFFDKIGPEGLHRMLMGWEDKRALAICTVALIPEAGRPALVFRGEMPGTIVQPRGNDAFGWGPCFQPDGLDMTVAELPAELKHRVSHRAKAIANLKEYFLRQAKEN